MVQPLWKAVWRFLRKLNIELPFDPAIPLLGIYPEKTTTRKDTCTLMFITTLFAIAKTWKQPKCPSTEEWLKKMWYRSSRCGTAEMNPTRNHEVEGSIPGLAQWVKDPVSPSAVV